jgi:hypothetical protein
MINEACLDSCLSVALRQALKYKDGNLDWQISWSIKVKQLATTFLQNRDPIPESQGDEFVKSMGG